ncbi:methyl-accepting chemotaxis protein [Vibrio cholerae]|nr:methyl-accepting chemotaxis protein [Vibrio cholerae]
MKAIQGSNETAQATAEQVADAVTQLNRVFSAIHAINEMSHQIVQAPRLTISSAASAIWGSIA